MWMSRKEACIVAVSIAVRAWLTGALQVNNAQEVACCTRVYCARRSHGALRQRRLFVGMRPHWFRIDRGVMDASKRGTSQRAMKELIMVPNTA